MTIPNGYDEWVKSNDNDIIKKLCKENTHEANYELAKILIHPLKEKIKQKEKQNE